MPALTNDFRMPAPGRTQVRSEQPVEIEPQPRSVELVGQLRRQQVAEGLNGPMQEPAPGFTLAGSVAGYKQISRASARADSTACALSARRVASDGGGFAPMRCGFQSNMGAASVPSPQPAAVVSAKHGTAAQLGDVGPQVRQGVGRLARHRVHLVRVRTLRDRE